MGGLWPVTAERADGASGSGWGSRPVRVILWSKQERVSGIHGKRSPRLSSVHPHPLLPTPLELSARPFCASCLHAASP